VKIAINYEIPSCS